MLISMLIVSGNVLRRLTVGCLFLPLGAALLLSSCGARSEPGPQSASDRDERPNVVLVVLDTFRRDRIHTCGDGRPPTPFLDRLAETSTVWCNAILAGSWTLPSHASLFTGVLPPEHGADFDPLGEAPPGSDAEMKMRGLGPELPTLAEVFAHGGYRSVLVGGNPILKPPLGLARGYETAWVAPGFGVLEEASIAPVLRQLLDEATPDERPWFVTLNVILAHGPHEEIPDGVGWVPKTPRMDVMVGGEDSPFSRFYDPQTSDEERQEFLERFADLYDWGVYLADEDLRRAFVALADHGVFDDRTIVAVTSDHGELLGEHGELHHGRTVALEVVGSFVVLRAPGSETFVAGTERSELVQPHDLFATLPELVGIEVPAGTHARSLADPDPERIAIAVSQPDAWFARMSHGRLGRDRDVLVAQGDMLVTWTDPPGQIVGEVSEAFAHLVDQAETWGAKARLRGGVDVELDEESRRALVELGYIE